MMDTFKIRNNKVIYNGNEYDFDNLLENVVFNGDITIFAYKLCRLPDISSWIINGNFSCSHNELQTLDGCPKEVCGTFMCEGNKLTSLIGSPRKIGGDFYCCWNHLLSLEGCPKEVGGVFKYSFNVDMRVIDSWPEYIGGDYSLGWIVEIKENAMSLDWLIKFYKKNLYNSMELLMKKFGCNTKEELNTYLLMMEKI